MRTLKTCGKYTLLLNTNANYTPFIVVYNYNGETWQQGHYFTNELDARKFLIKKL